MMIWGHKLSKSLRKFFNRPFSIVFCLVLILCAFGIGLFFMLDALFPNNGGYNRNIFFIKESPEGPGYFLIVDEIYQTRNDIPVDWVLHGRGNLSIFNDNQSAVWTVPSYLNSTEIVKLYAIFVEPKVTISSSIGPFYPTQSYKDNPIMLPYIKARATQNGPTRFVTILFPTNGSQLLPNITTANGLTQIGVNDRIFTQTSSALRTFNNLTTDAELLYFRLQNATIANFILKEGQILSQLNRSYLVSDKSLSLNLEYHSSNISGQIWIKEPVNLSLWVPNAPKTTTINGIDFIAKYNNINQTLSFALWENGTIFISYNPYKAPSIEDPLPSSEKVTSPIVKDGDTKSPGVHPSLFFNVADLPTLRSRVLLEQPWQSWFATIEANADYHLFTNISTLDANARPEPALNLAFTGIIRQNLTYIQKSKEFLQAMNQITDYYSHLELARASSYYAIAYDMIYANLTPSERIEIEGKFVNHTTPLVTKMQVIPRNNHLGVVSSGLGLAGLALGKTDWVNLAISGIDDCLSTTFAPMGGDYEGYYYAGYFLESGLKFFFGLQNAGVKNYFADPKFLNFINSTIYSLSPLTTTPLFEDSTTDSQILEDLLWAAPNIFPYAPLLSNYSQWVWKKRLSNDALTYEGTYLQSYQDSTVSRICLYSFNITPEEPPFTPLSIWSDAGLAFFRTDWTADALYLSITCKANPNFQYHGHYDENSFEIWAYGAWLAANPGYPGYGYGEYDWITSTTASNTLLMNNAGQQQVNGEGFQEYFRSSTADCLVASANSIYSSPGNYARNPSFLGVLIFIFMNLLITCLIIIPLRRRTYQTDITFLLKEKKQTVAAIKARNLSLKVHLTILFGLIFGIIISLSAFFFSANFYVQEYLVGKHAAIANLIPGIEFALLIIIIPLIVLLMAFKFKMQNAVLNRVVHFSLNLKGTQIPPLRSSIKLTYLPQVFFLIIFIPIILFFYLPLLQNTIQFIFTRSGSLLDLQNYFISTLNNFILLFASTLLLYLPFKIMGLYYGGRSLSADLDQPISESILMLTASYLLTLTCLMLLVFYVTLTLFFTMNLWGIEFFVV
jgi:hypothetical protein